MFAKWRTVRRCGARRALMPRGLCGVAPVLAGALTGFPNLGQRVVNMSLGRPMEGRSRSPETHLGRQQILPTCERPPLLDSESQTFRTGEGGRCGTAMRECLPIPRTTDHAAQIEALKAAGCERIFSEKASGKSTNGRPELAQLAHQLRK
jgi:Resolvase, N terminal domain